MVDILLLQTVSIAIASAGVFLAAIYYILQIRHQRKMRQSDLVLRLYATFGSNEFQERWTEFVKGDYKGYDDFVKKYDIRSNPAPESSWLFEALGVLLKNKLIDISLVDDLFTGPSKWFWEKLKPIAEDTRKQFNYPQYAEHIEYLYNEMKKREQRLQQSTAKGE
jgi:hypothetical protein